MNTYDLKPIGFMNTCFPEKFGIPRQSLLSPNAKGQLTLVAPFNHPDCVMGLEHSSHIWLSFIFHQHLTQGWKPKVRPPRLGGNKKLGVFATRSSFRPNALGLSVVKLDNIIISDEQVTLSLSGVDLVDGTPIVDIKPYVPYVDSVSDATHALPFTTPVPSATSTTTPITTTLDNTAVATSAPKKVDVEFADTVIKFCEQYQQHTGIHLQALITEVLAQQPQPAYQHDTCTRDYGTRLYDCNIRWRVADNNIRVLTIEQQ